MSENKPNNSQITVHDATYNLLRKLGLTTIFGNPGSTEQRNSNRASTSAAGAFRSRLASGRSETGNIVSANCLTEIRMKRIEDHLEGHSEGLSRAATTGVLSLRDTFFRSTSNVFTHRLSGQSLVR
jgi:hypothetical protein